MAHRILLVSDTYKPLIGGAERQIGLLGRQLITRGHAVRLATTWFEGLPEVEDDAGLTVHRLKSLTTRLPRRLMPQGWQRHHPPFPDLGVVLELRRLVDTFQPTVVQSYGWITFSVAAALLGTTIPLIASGREYAYQCANRLLLRAGRHCEGPALPACLSCAFQRYGRLRGAAVVGGMALSQPLLRRRLTAFHSISRFIQQMARRDLKLRGDTVDVVINNLFVPERERAADPAVMAQLPKEPFILFVGGLQINKGVGVLIEAYRRLNRPPPLVLIGSIRPDSITDLPADVILLRNLPHADVMGAWDRCLFGTLPSLSPEALGNVMLEAMSAGKAAIGTVPGGFADLITDGESGLLVPAGDVGALADAMQRLTDDAALRERLGAAARQRLRQFLPEQIIPQFEDLYTRLSSAQPAGRAQRV